MTRTMDHCVPLRNPGLLKDQHGGFRSGLPVRHEKDICGAAVQQPTPDRYSCSTHG
jgi:hypothetical protein